MAGCKAPGSRALGVVLAVVAALLAVAAAASAVDDEHMYHWKCFKSCTGNCRDDEDVAAVDDCHHSGSGGSNASAVSGGKCKHKCLNECFEDLPALCYHQCVVSNCLCFPPFSKEKTVCLKNCCDKCFHPGPPAPGPGPKPPKPPTPGPPKPPAPTKPKPPPAPKPKPAPSPKPKPPTPKAPPPPKKPCPCPPGSDEVNNN